MPGQKILYRHLPVGKFKSGVLVLQGQDCTRGQEMFVQEDITSGVGIPRALAFCRNVRGGSLTSLLEMQMKILSPFFILVFTHTLRHPRLNFPTSSLPRPIPFLHLIPDDHLLHLILFFHLLQRSTAYTSPRPNRQLSNPSCP